MRITKTSVKATDIIEPALEPAVDVIVPEECTDSQVTEESCSACDYTCARESIMKAIECLGESAKQMDEKARDAIANLSVIYFDLEV